MLVAGAKQLPPLPHQPDVGVGRAPGFGGLQRRAGDGARVGSLRNPRQHPRGWKRGGGGGEKLSSADRHGAGDASIRTCYGSVVRGFRSGVRESYAVAARELARRSPGAARGWSTAAPRAG